MLVKMSRPMIGKISELLVSGNRVVFFDVATSQKSLLELKIHSPRGVKNYDLGGVGLGIVAALDKTGDVGGGDILARFAISSPRPIRTDPIPVSHVKNCCRIGACQYGRNDFDMKSKNASIFSVSPARCPEDTNTAFPMSDFLSSCHLCMKRLHGKDIYMYRGEKAFCSTECRERQIIIDDDRIEQCRYEATRSVDVSSSPYAQGNIFSTGILAI